MGDTKCPYCDGTTTEHDPACGTLLPPITGTVDVSDLGDRLAPRSQEEEDQ